MWEEDVADVVPHAPRCFVEICLRDFLLYVLRTSRQGGQLSIDVSLMVVEILRRVSECLYEWKIVYEWVQEQDM